MRYKLARPWTPEDIEELRRLATVNSPIRIAARMKRTVRSVESKARLHGIKLKTLAEVRGLSPRSRPHASHSHEAYMVGREPERS